MKAAVLIFGGVIIAIASLKMFMNFETYMKLAMKAEEEYKQFSTITAPEEIRNIIEFY